MLDGAWIEFVVSIRICVKGAQEGCKCGNARN